MNITNKNKDGLGKSPLARRVTAGVVRLMLVSPVLERIVLALLRTLRARQPAKAIWWRLPAQFGERTLGTGAELRWVGVPGTNAQLLISVNSNFGSLYFERSSYEPATTDFIHNTLRPGNVFVDIGANIGYFTVLAASVVGHSGRVIAFEPNPGPRGMLQQSVSKNRLGGHVRLFDCALADAGSKDTKLYLSNDPWNSGISSMVPWQGHLDSGNLSENNVITVQTRTFDSIVEELCIDRVDMIKIDVEGAELRVLKGMRRLLEGIRPANIICETAMGSEADGYLRSLGYSGRSLELHNSNAAWGNILFTSQARNL